MESDEEFSLCDINISIAGFCCSMNLNKLKGMTIEQHRLLENNELKNKKVVE